MCQFGMTSPITGSHGDVGHAKKPTGFLSISRFVAKELNRYCDGCHGNMHLVAGKVAAAQVYPPALCKAMKRGISNNKPEKMNNNNNKKKKKQKKNNNTNNNNNKKNKNN